MKKTCLFSLLLVLVSLVCSFLIACGKVEFEIIFIVDNQEYTIINTAGNENISMPVNPQKEGYEFDGWYWDHEIWQRPFTANSLLNQPLDSDMKVYAKFTENEILKGTDANFIGFEKISGNTNDYYGIIVHNDVSIFSFSDYVEVSGQTTWILSTDVSAQNTIISKTVELQNGDNTFYVTTMYGNSTKSYKLIVYRLSMYTVSFNTNSGTPTQEEQIIEENSFIDRPETDPEKLGYTFDNWNYDFTQPITNNTTITALYTPITYHITYVLNGGRNAPTRQSFTIEDSFYISSPSKTGYNFIGWYDNENFESYSISYINHRYSDITLYAKWTVVIYSITYYLNNGTNADNNPIKYTIEDETLMLQNPTKLGYDFDGWYRNQNFTGEKVLEIVHGSYGNIVLYSKWQPTEYSIIYHLNNGTNNENNPTTYNIKTETIELLGSNKNHYNFIGWYDNENFDGNVITEINIGSYGNIELFAKYEPINYTITYYLNGGTNSSNNPRSYNIETETTILEEPTKDGYTFGGWFDNINFNNLPITQITKGSFDNIRLWCKWSANSNKIIFNSNNGSGYMDDLIAETNETVTLSKNLFTREFYTFAGWSTTQNGNIAYLDESNYKMGVNSEYHLYAVWNPINFNITYNLNGGDSNNNKTLYNIETETFTLSSCSKFGYQFGGWFNNSDLTGNSITQISKGTTGDIVLWAKWNLVATTLRINNTTNNPVTAKLNIYKSDTSNTSITINGTTTNTTQSGSQDISITMPKGESFITITSNGTWYFDDECFNTVECQGYITGVVLDNMYGKTIKKDVFNYCGKLTYFDISENVTSIDESAFYCCRKLSYIDLSNVKSIGRSAFLNCTTLNNLVFCENLSRIEWYAFQGCSGLKNVSFGNNVNGWKVTSQKVTYEPYGQLITLSTPLQNAKYLTETYYDCIWFK